MDSRRDQVILYTSFSEKLVHWLLPTLILNFIRTSFRTVALTTVEADRKYIANN